LSGGDHCWFKRSTGKKRPVTRYNNNKNNIIIIIIIIRGGFNEKVGRENIFKPTIGQERLHQDSNDNGVRLVNFATSKNLVVKSTMFPHRNIHKYNWTSPDGKTHNQIDHILIDRR
jgi:hypothetical protein